LTEYFNTSPAGNWKPGENILAPTQTPGEFAARKKISTGQFASLLDSAKVRLLSERSKRKKPSVDTKILTSWNAILLKAFTDAYVATSEEKYLAKAFVIANFLEKNMLGDKGDLKRIFKDGKATVSGFLDDYAWTAFAFIKLYQVSLDKHWLDLSKKIADFVISNFYNKSLSLFYYSSVRESKLVVNNIETDDEVIPSSNSIMATALYSLGVLYDKEDFITLSEEMLRTVAEKLKTFPEYHAKWCSLAGLFAKGTIEIALMGKDAVSKNKTLQKNFLPDCIIMGGDREENLPLLENKLVVGKTLIYVCTNKVCKRPVEEVDQALTEIKTRSFLR
jgi:uncharacterized protein YyaL (SSP411 family)